MNVHVLFQKSVNVVFFNKLSSDVTESFQTNTGEQTSLLHNEKQILHMHHSEQSLHHCSATLDYQTVLPRRAATSVVRPCREEVGVDDGQQNIKHA